MSRWKALLAILLLLSLTLVVVGCQDNSSGPDPGNDPGNVPSDDPGNNPGNDPGTDPGNVPGDDPGTDPSDDPGTDPGEIPGTDPGEDPIDDLDPNALTLVPDDQIGLVDKAIIRQGDLWLGSYDGQLWRQTDSGDVTDFVWAPNGHGLIYFRNNDHNTMEQDLYYMALGQAPVLLDANAITQKAWMSKEGWLWSPDSDAVAYGIQNGEQIRITWLPDLTKTDLPLDAVNLGHLPQDYFCNMGPYWLSPGILVYGTGTERPGVVIINAVGQMLSDIPDSTRPYPIPDGLILATGIYDPDGVMENFYSTGLARANPDGSGISQVYNESVRFCQMDRDPVLPGGLTLPRYLAISDCQTLFLQKYAGPPTKAYPNKVELLTQDMFLTFSEFCYPFWFSWAPNGSQIAALRFTLTQPGDHNEQEGFWDLVLVDEQANQNILLEEIYSVSGDQRPVPLQDRLPLNWSRQCTHVNYLKDRADENGHDWWQVDINTGVCELVLENSGLPGYRPEP